ILNIPHSNINGTENAGWNSQYYLSKAIMQLTDWHTQILFNPNKEKFDAENDFTVHVFNKSRFVVDVERLLHDDMEKIGQGILYTRYGDNLTREIDETQRKELMQAYFDYNSKLRQSVIQTNYENRRPILIDCHSFADDGSNVDVCIGFNDDFSRPSEEIISRIIDIYKSKGFNVGINTPYSNSIQPIADKKELHTEYFSFMVELNKRTYLTPDSITLCDDFNKITVAIHEMYDYLLNA
ncbi:MAG: N-formylglutamate amidohydrolase, partial [Prevotella sp.]|nr:N-formylglutamate amidohydrolase [Prevotella sp.]